MTLELFQIFANFGVFFRVFWDYLLEFVNFEIIDNIISFVMFVSIAQLIELFLNLLDAWQHFARLDLIHDLLFEFDRRQIFDQFQCLVNVFECLFGLVQSFVRNGPTGLCLETYFLVALDAVI